jgi:hypothetical protein
VKEDEMLRKESFLAIGMVFLIVLMSGCSGKGKAAASSGGRRECRN